MLHWSEHALPAALWQQHTDSFGQIITSLVQSAQTFCLLRETLKPVMLHAQVSSMDFKSQAEIELVSVVGQNPTFRIRCPLASLDPATVRTFGQKRSHTCCSRMGVCMPLHACMYAIEILPITPGVELMTRKTSALRA